MTDNQLLSTLEQFAHNQLALTEARRQLRSLGPARCKRACAGIRHLLLQSGNPTLAQYFVWLSQLADNDLTTHVLEKEIPYS